MALVTLQLKLLSGANRTLQVPRDIEIEELEDRVARHLGGPISGLVHQGMRLQKGRQLSDYLQLNYNLPFYVLPYMTSYNKRSIVNMSNTNRQNRAHRLESHLENLMSPIPRGLATRQGSNEIRQRANALRELQTIAARQALPENIEGAIGSYLGGKRKKSRRRSSKKTRKAKQTRRR